MSKSAWFALSLLLFALPVSAEVQRTTGTRGGKPYLEMTNDRVMIGTVIAIDKKTREVKLLNEAGDTLTVTAGDHVKNLAQVQVADVVKLRIKESLTIEVASTPAVKDTQDVSVTYGKPGEKPHGTITERSRTTATIVAIDKATSTVTLQATDGNPFTIKAKKKETLDKIKVGDLIVFTAVKSTATSLEKAPAK